MRHIAHRFPLVGCLAAIAIVATACGSEAPPFTPYAFDSGGRGLPGDVGGTPVDGGASGGGATDGSASGGSADSGSASGGTADGGTGDSGSGGSTDTGGVALDAGTTDSGTTDSGTADSGATDSGATDSGATDSGITDSGTTDSGTVDSGTVDSGAIDSGTIDSGKAEDIPWGSQPDAAPYDAGQYNYGDVKSTGGNTGSGGAGLCIPKISQLNLEKIKVGGKVDIIIFVDTSGSMGQEAKYVSSNLNNFGNYLAGKALDYRVILLGKDTSCCKLTIGPPLGNNPAVYKHVQKPVYSTDGLKRIIDYYPDYQAFLRKDATKNFLAITDDESFQMTSAVFEQKAAALQNPGFGQNWVFHSIVAYGPLAKKGCSTGARIGQQYLNLTAKTGGVKKPVCDNNWTQIFNDIAKGVVQTAKPPCTHTIPLPTGVSNAKGVNVNYVAEDDFFNVPPASNNSCPANGVGYTLDNPNNPKKITLCNNSCDLLKGGGNIQFDFGCFL